MIRLAHLSDIHIAATELEWRREDWFNKRLAAWFNFRVLGRGFRFRYSPEVLEALVNDLNQRSVDHIIFSGDATALGFESELRRAAELLKVETGVKGIAVPGNHDYCTTSAARSGLFERYFAPWQTGVRVDDHIYPFAQRVGPAWLIGVNSSTGNRIAWDAGGSVGIEQLERLKVLFEKLDPGPRILVTHFPVCLASGKPETVAHGLRDLQAVVHVAAQGGVCLWLHGHRHSPYFLPSPPLAPFPVMCAGSATQTGLWTHFEYALDEQQIQVTRRVYEPATRTFQPVDLFSVALC